jgi:hypothetical protein
MAGVGAPWADHGECSLERGERGGRRRGEGVVAREWHGGC